MDPAPQPSESAQLTSELNSPAPPPGRARSVLQTIGRAAAWWVFVPPRRGLRAWARLRPAQQLALGFASYVLIGTLLLALPFAQASPAPLLDHLFTAASAVSTTGLSTVSIADTYTFFGELVVLILFQLGGIGYMTLSSLILLARGRNLSPQRLGVLRAGFAVPHYFVLPRFVVQVAVFTLAVEGVGAAVLWWRFSALGVEEPLWHAIFHAVSAFATAGFSLNNNSLEPFAGDWIVNLTIAVLCYLGAIGFIVVQDVWYSLRLRERMLTFTSKVILTMSLAIFLAATLAVFFLDPSVRGMPADDRLLASAFQAMTASTTAGFNTIPIAQMGLPALLVILAVMLVGASPAGTGGGIKTTSVSALLANLTSVLRGRDRVVWLRHEIPMARLLLAHAAATLYLGVLAIGVLLLSLTEKHQVFPLIFEAASAIGTVGLSMGLTAELSPAGKLIIILLMFIGRCGPLTLGLALLRPDTNTSNLRRDDLAV